jgi:hypothetical protein
VGNLCQQLTPNTFLKKYTYDKMHVGPTQIDVHYSISISLEKKLENNLC